MRLTFWALGLLVAGIVAVALLVGYALLVAAPNLPSLDTITDYRPKIPLRIYTADNVLIGEFGEERRNFVPIAEIPDVMKKAVLAIEDDRFYEHGGVDFVGVLRAGLANLRGGLSQGASTITMQVARNFYLSREKTLSRKWYEILLAWKIDRSLPKDRILELYMNQVYLGEHAYGFGSAAQAYFGKPLDALSLAETAMLAGLPKAPSTMNPVVNFPRAKLRQQYVLGRMQALGMISHQQYQAARAETLKVAGSHNGRFDGHAEYVAELARQLAYDRFGEAAYTRGLNVYTTVSSVRQSLAYEAVHAGLDQYGKRHGQQAAPQAALVSLDSRSGAIEAMIGGADFATSRFNHATQALRQPGSTFKPFIYSAALERGVSATTLINDAPLDASSRWQPGNDDGRFLGAVSVRQALAESRNLPAIRTLQTIGIPYAVDYAGKFGFSEQRLPRYLPMALGTGTTTPLRLAAAYGVFASEGYRTEPYLIERISDGAGNVLFTADSEPQPHRVIPERNAYVMNSLLRSVVTSGTGAGLQRYLRRADVAGKTGTTNDSVDGWFAGYASGIVTVAWMGFDDNRSLGRHEFGATTALPIWASYMEGRLAGQPEAEFVAPKNLVRNGDDWVYPEYADGSHGIAALGFPAAPADADPGAATALTDTSGGSGTTAATSATSANGTTGGAESVRALSPAPAGVPPRTSQPTT